jgi:RNA polymerase sigma-70 factor (ECF subfamily)
MRDSSHHPLVSARSPVPDRQPYDGIAQLWREEAAGLERFLLRRTADGALAEELVAETFARAMRSWHLYDDRRASAKTWLYAIAVNCHRADRRRLEVERAALARMPRERDHVPPAHDDVALRIDLARMLRALTAEEREALLLRYGRDLSMRQIAAETRTSLTTADGRVHRALRKLRLALELDDTARRSA